MDKAIHSKGRKALNVFIEQSDDKAEADAVQQEGSSEPEPATEAVHTHDWVAEY